MLSHGKGREGTGRQLVRVRKQGEDLRESGSSANTHSQHTQQCGAPVAKQFVGTPEAKVL